MLNFELKRRNIGIHLMFKKTRSGSESETYDCNDKSNLRIPSWIQGHRNHDDKQELEITCLENLSEYCYTTFQNLRLDIPFSKSGQNFFDYFSQKFK